MKNMQQNNNLEVIRENFIRVLDDATNKELKVKEISNNLFELDLTMYSKDNTFDSLLYNSLACSFLDSSISLHPEQLKILSKIKNEDAIILSAPTSFGKTYCIFEYIARYTPNVVVLIVPTLALVDEYIKKIIKKYDKLYEEYKVYTQVKKNVLTENNKKIMYILTHDRVVNEDFYKHIDNINLLVIDEVYKLAKDSDDDRTLILNMAYFHLSKKAEKYILLAPFIEGIKDKEKLEKNPTFFHSNYSPVVNDVIVENINNENDRLSKLEEILSFIPNNEKTLIYFPMVTSIREYINEVIDKKCIKNSYNEDIKQFILWAKTEIHENWSVVKAIERGYLVHNGQIPLGIRNFILDIYEKNERYNRLICTSTLLEGVNTVSKNIIITKPSRSGENAFSSFDFFNLVGRTGRLNRYLIGKAYYIKSNKDRQYKKEEAISKIQFEITQQSTDINIQQGNYKNEDEYLCFLNKLNIKHEDYIINIGAKFRFKTIKELYNNYLESKEDLILLLKEVDRKEKKRYDLLVALLKIMREKNCTHIAFIVNSLLNYKRPSIKSIVDERINYLRRKNKINEINNIDKYISTIIKVKSSYIEHTLYSKLLILRYFLQIENIANDLLAIIDTKIIKIIDSLYFTSSKQKKMIEDLGVYDKDIDYIIEIIGDDFDDTKELKNRLKNNLMNMKKLSFISKYIINNL